MLETGDIILVLFNSGRCPPARAFASDHQIASARHSFDNEEKTFDIMASTPCSSTGTKLRKPKFKNNKPINLQKQIFQKEFTPEMEQLKSEEKSTDSIAIEDIDGVFKNTKRQIISPILESPIDDIDILSLEMSSCLHVDQKMSRPDNDDSLCIIAVQGKSSFSIHTPGHAEMTFLVSINTWHQKHLKHFHLQYVNV